MQAFLSKAREKFTKALGFTGRVLAETLAVLTRPSIVALLGAALISRGVMLIYYPAGLMVAGVFLILAALDSRS